MRLMADDIGRDFRELRESVHAEQGDSIAHDSALGNEESTMQTQHRSPKLIAAGVVLLVTLGSVSASAQLVPVKFGLDDLKEKDQDQLATLVDQLAKVEAILERCDVPPHYDSKLRAKVEPCIEADSIERIQGFFEQRLKVYREALDPKICDKPELKEKIPEVKRGMIKALKKIGRMCSLCLFC
jgi:hypothetical protein